MTPLNDRLPLWLVLAIREALRLGAKVDRICLAMDTNEHQVACVRAGGWFGDKFLNPVDGVRRVPRITQGSPQPSHRSLRMAALYAKGASLEAVGAQFGVSGSRVMQILEAHGVKRRRGGRPPSNRAAAEAAE